MPVSRRSLLLSGAALMAAAASPAPLLAATPRNTLRFVPQADIQMLDPVVTSSYNTRNFAYMIWDTLFAMDAEFRPQPQMVERWSVSADGLTYDFTLRDGLTWHDGLTAAKARQR